MTGADMAEAASSETIWLREIENESALPGFAAEIAELLGPGSVVTLSGGLGAGKTAFARALIRHLSGDQGLEVPSPAFTLMQIYGGLNYPIVHADFYRIAHKRELAELGFEEACEGALVLVEWAERAGDALPADRLDIEFALDREHDPGYRVITLRGSGSFSGKLAHAKATREILQASGWLHAKREFLQGDASVRSYERLVKPDGSSAILMHSPPRPDGPAVRFGKPYSALAKLAEDIRPFVAVAHGLRGQGLSAPQILACDFDAGLAVIEDFGSEPITDAAGIIEERYAVALAALSHLHGGSPSDTLPLDGGSYRIPPYDLDALMIEVELLLDWYVPYVACVKLASGPKAAFVNAWRQVLQDVLAVRPVWTLRDYHSPNLLWLAGRDGIAKVGILDFQDCVMGHPAYDVVSLLQDARVDVPQEIELRLLGRYVHLRREVDADFDIGGFARAYAILGAQRATKILGIFARLDERDHKPQYLANLPRVEKYLARNLCHPALASVKRWHEEHLPAMMRAPP